MESPTGSKQSKDSGLSWSIEPVLKDNLIEDPNTGIEQKSKESEASSKTSCSQILKGDVTSENLDIKECLYPMGFYAESLQGNLDCEERNSPSPILPRR